MKKLLSVVLTFLLFSCVSLEKVEISKSKSKKEIDLKLCGSWSGSEIGHQYKDTERHWIQHRFDNGTFVIIFINIKDSKVTKSSEKGEWWVKDGTFFEQHPKTGKIDTYEYKFLAENMVLFSAKSLSTNTNNSDYKFIDTRVD